MARKQDKIVFPSGAGYPFSNAIRAGDFVYVSGQLAFLPDGSISTGSIEEQGHKNILTKTDRFYLDAIRRKRIAAFTSIPSRRGMKLGLLDGDSKMVAAT